MSDSDPDSKHYPNADGRAETAVTVPRRRLLAGSAAAGVVAAAGCLEDDTDEADGVVERPTVFVFNTGDGTVSLVDVETDEVVGTVNLGSTSSFPANQFTPRLTDGPRDPLWLNVDRGVRAFEAGTLSQRATLDTGSGANWQERTPDGDHLVVSAREPVHTQYRLDADPDSETFGEVTAELDRTDEGGRGDRDGPGPCDVTVHPDGEYAYVPDLFGDTLTVLGIDPFEVVSQVDVAPVGDGPPAPWMGTVAWDGETLLVENDEGATGTESIWDVSDPTAPTEVVRLTADDGLGNGPLTSEIGPDSEVGYVFTPDSEDVTVLDLTARAVLDRLDLGGPAFVGTWDPDREKLYVPVQSADEVAVIDHAAREVVARISVGSRPYGATAARLRPARDAATAIEGKLAQLGVFDDYGTTYCIGECACGHRL